MISEKCWLFSYFRNSLMDNLNNNIAILISMAALFRNDLATPIRLHIKCHFLSKQAFSAIFPKLVSIRNGLKIK